MEHQTQALAQCEKEIRIGEYFAKGNVENARGLLDKLHSNRLYLIKKNRDALHLMVIRFARISLSDPQIFMLNSFIEEIRLWKDLYSRGILEKIEQPYAVKNPFEIYHPGFQTFLEDVIYDTIGLKAKQGILPFERILKTRESILGMEKKYVSNYLNDTISARTPKMHTGNRDKPLRNHIMDNLNDFVVYLLDIFEKMEDVDQGSYPVLYDAVNKLRK